MNTELIDIKELKQISVRITCKHESENPKIGTGTIISDGINYYVMTAAHCIERGKNSGRHYDLNEISLHCFLGGNEQQIILNEILEFIPKAEKDCALLLIEKPELDFDYVNSIKRLADTYGKSAELFGYIKRKNDGRRFDLCIADENVWSVNSMTEKGLIADEVLPGMSGAGLCIKKDGIIYCIGYVKGFKDLFCSFDDIKVYPITNFTKLPSSTLVKSLINPAIPIKSNESKIKYGQLWCRLKNDIWNKKDFHSLLDQTYFAKKSYPNPKSIHHQKEIISYLLEKKEVWNDDERKVFALSLYDCGLLPNMFQEVIQNIGDLDPILEWKYLIQRQVSLTCNMPEEIMTPSDDDRGIYELILRAAFCLDFTKMYKLLIGWSPSGMWIAKRALLINLYQCKEADLAHELLEQYIEIGNLCLEDKFVASNIYNVIDRNLKKKYDYTDFWNAGIDSTSEILSYISDQIDHKKDEIKLYGIHYTTIIGGEDYSSFPESLRFLQYIINTGITTNFRNTYFVKKEHWFKVYKRLFHFFPYPCIYYTLQYNDEKLVRRAAQEMAYTDEEDFIQKLPEILCKLLDIVNCEVKPQNLFLNNFYFTQELYIAVKEENWYDKFCNSILKIFCDNITLENVSKFDAIFLNVFTAINSLQDSQKKISIFIKLINTLPKNPYLVNILICDALVIDSSMQCEVVIATLDVMISNYEMQDICGILYIFQRKGLLSSNQLQRIDAKSIIGSMQFAKNDCTSIIRLSNLVYSSEPIKILKSFVLVKDIWNCGITSAHYTEPSPWHIESFSDLIQWEENEWEYIKKNMIDNLMLIQERHDKIKHYSAFNSTYLNLISDMRQFLIKQKEKNNRNVDDVMLLLNEVHSLKLGYENIMDAITADNYERVSSAVKFLNQSIYSEGITNYFPQVRMIIARVLLKKQECLYLCILLLVHWTVKYPAMVETFGDELCQILRNFYDYNYEVLDLSVPKINKELHILAGALEVDYGTEAIVQYWLNDPKPNRFNL